MDSDDEEMLAALMDDEIAAASETGDDEHWIILSSLLAAIAEESKPVVRGGSRPGHRKSKARLRMAGYCMLYSDYFANEPLHDEVVFRRRYRMNRGLFLKIVERLWEYDDYFKLKRDAVGELGFSTIQKCTVALRILAYGVPADSADDYLRMAESTAIACMYKFCKAIIAVFGDYYLRSPTEADTARILAQNA